MDQELDLSVYAIGLSLVQGVGGQTARKMVELAGGLPEVFQISPRDFSAIKGIKKAVISSLQHDRVLERAREEWKRVQAQRLEVLFIGDSNYPYRFARCPDAPVVLYQKGSLSLNGQRMLSVVGTRKCSDYGKELTHQLIKDLAPYQVVVVSGLAYGIDIAAHRAALENGLPTIACMAQGLDRIYPGTHAKEARAMLENGAWVTEFPTNHRPKREHFPTRNRIIAGISDATLVVQSKVKGGSMLTADLAFSYHRDVFATPGSVHEPMAAGPHSLIRSLRAQLVTSGEDLAKQMGWKRAEPATQTILFPELDKNELEVMGCLQANPMHVDQLLQVYPHGRGTLMKVLLEMEMKGLVKALPGSRFGLSSALSSR